MKKYIGYIRVSTERQVDGFSLENQKKDIEDYCKDRNYELVGIFADEGVSGKNIEDREEFINMMRYVENKDVDGVIIWKISRISRNTSDFFTITKKLEDLGKKLISIKDNYDSTITTSKIIGMVHSFISEIEKDNIVMQVKGGMEQKAREGKWNGGYVPIGYSYDKATKKLTIKEEEKQIILEIFDRYIKGDGYLSIAKHLNSLGYKTRKNNMFSITAIKNILNNPFYIGKIRWGHYQNWEKKRRKGLNENPILADGDHKGIINEETYNLVQKKIKNNPKHNNDGKPSNYLLSGILKCPKCGYGMVVQKTANKKYNKTYYYYYCGAYANKKTCSPNTRKMEKIDGQFIDILDGYTKKLKKEDVKEALKRDRSKEKNNLEKDMERIKKAIKSGEARKENFLNAIGLGNAPAVDLNKQINKCNEEIVTVQM